MKKKGKSYSIALASTFIILFLILISSTASAVAEESFSSSAPYAYVTNYVDNTVSVVNTGTNNVTATVPVGISPYGVAATPDGTKVYVTNSGSNTVSVINTATNTVTALVTVGNEPKGIAITPDGKEVYVANTKYGDTPTISVIDTATNTVTATLELGWYQYGIAVSPDGKKIYVTNYAFQGSVSVIDRATKNVIATVPVGNYPSEIVVTPDGTKVYVGNDDDNTFSVIDTATNTVTATLFDLNPGGVAASPDGKKIYVTDGGFGGGIISVIDTTTNTVTDTMPAGNVPLGVAVTPDGTKVYVANYYNNEGSGISVIDTATKTVIATVPVGYYPRGIAISSSPKSVRPIANFSAKPTSGTAPLNVSFTDNSTGSPTAWKWSFGDGINSTEQNPTHEYSKAGNYTVVLTVSNSAGSNKITKPSYIKVMAVTRPVANFTSNVTSGNKPLDVAFTDKSTGTPTAWKWTFGDGTNSTIQNPTHTYSKAGNYTVVLTASNSAGSSKITKSSYIKVKAVTRPVANFISNVTSGYAPLNVSFTDESSGSPASWNWSFGDGINSTQQNPTHEYLKAGNYTVVLTASNSAGSSKITKPSYIKVVKR